MKRKKLYEQKGIVATVLAVCLVAGAWSTSHFTIESKASGSQGNGMQAEIKSESVSSFGVENPRIVSDSSMESGQRVTYDVIEFGSYYQYDGLDTDGGTYHPFSFQDATYYSPKNVPTPGGAGPVRDNAYYNWIKTNGGNSFQYEPIQWRVLSVEGDKALLLADRALDDKEFFGRNLDSPLTWENSVIRSWLNGYGAAYNAQNRDYQDNNFIDHAFDSEQQVAIISTLLNNEDTNMEQVVAENNTTDQIFLLSYADMLNPKYGFVADATVNDEARRSKYSQFAWAMGISRYVSESEEEAKFNNNCRTWLRSKEKNGGEMMTVSYEGTVRGDYGETIGCRPALYLDLSKTDLYRVVGTMTTNKTSETIIEPKTTGDPTPTPEVTYTEGDYKYTVQDGTAKIIEYGGNETSVVIPEQLGGYQVTTIGYNAFYLNGIIEITIPKNITNVEAGAVSACLWLERIIVDAENTQYQSVDNALLSKDKKELIFCALGSHPGTYVVPDGVERIAPGAFWEGQLITNIILPDGLKSIGGGAFYHTSIERLVIPESVTVVKEDFEGCHKLKEIYCMGNAPEFRKYSLMNRFTIYFLSDKSGWTSPEWNGYKSVGIEKLYKGDVDLDADVDLDDISSALKYALTIETPDKLQLFAADADENGEVDLDDVRECLKVALTITSFE